MARLLAFVPSLLVLLLCGPAAAQTQPRGQIVAAGSGMSLVVYEPLHRPVSELLPLAQAVSGKPVKSAGDQLLVRVPEAEAKGLVALLDRLDRRVPEAYVILQVEELLLPTGAAGGRARVLSHRQLRLRVRQGSPSELLLSENDTTEGAKARVQKIHITPASIGAEGFHATLRFELDVPADAGPGDTEQPNSGHHRRQGEVKLFVPSARLTTIVDADLGTERGGRRRFRVQVRAVTGAAAAAVMDWEGRVTVVRILADTPPVAVLRFDGKPYQVRAGAVLGALKVVSIVEDVVTFKAGHLTFKGSPRQE